MITRTFASTAGEEFAFLTAGEYDFALRLTDFMDSDLDYRLDRKRGRGGSVEICYVFALILDIND